VGARVVVLRSMSYCSACCRMPIGLEDVSKYPDLFDRLAESRPGEPIWTGEDLEKLAGLNLIRVLQEVERVSNVLT